METMIGNLII